MFGLGVVAFALAGCASEVVEQPPTKNVVVSNAPDESANRGMKVLSETVKVGEVAPDFEIMDGDGKSWKLSDYRGKAVLLDFWGFWCPFCVKELPELREMNDKYEKNGFVLLGINNDSDPVSEIKKQLGESVVNWRQGFIGEGHQLEADYKVSAYPMKVLIDPTGKIVYIDNFIEKDEIEKHLPKVGN